MSTTFAALIRAIEPTAGDCWPWPGSRDKDGYGRWNSGMAHRAVYRQLRGEIPAGYEVDHLCRTRSCVNPEHLEPVTPLENRRRVAARRTHCKHGHEFTPENTLKVQRGRICRACGRVRAAQSRGRVA